MSYQHMGFWDKVGLKKEKEKAKQDYDEPLESSIAPTMTSATCLSRLHLLSPESRAWGKQCCWYHFSIDWCVDYTFLWRRMALTFVLNWKKKLIIIGLNQDQLYSPLEKCIAESILKDVHFSYVSLWDVATVSCIQMNWAGTTDDVAYTWLWSIVASKMHCLWDASDKL